jgi:osmotically-inducible protein OsmY
MRILVILAFAGALAGGCTKDRYDREAVETTSRTDKSAVVAPSATVDDDDADLDETTAPLDRTDDMAGDVDNDSYVDENNDDARDEDRAADNTARNKVDRNNATVTPIDQGNDKSDLEITAAIRRSLVKNDDLSTDAKNVKIITQNGHVTLRGPVESAGELRAIEKTAREIAGATRVDSHLQVAGH